MTFQEFINEFFRITENIQGSRFSLEHIIFGTCVTLLIIFLGVFFGLRHRNVETKKRNRFILICSIVMWAFEIAHFISIAARGAIGTFFKYESLLFLCDIQFFAIPLLIVTKGRFRDALCGFCICLGILTAVMGVWLNAAFDGCPVWTGRIWWTTVIHGVPGIIALYIPISGMYRLKLKEMWMSFAVVGPFIILNIFVNYISFFAEYVVSNSFGIAKKNATNYMFMIRPDGTPFSLFEGWSGGNLAIYTLFVILGMLFYIAVYYLVWALFAWLIRTGKFTKLGNWFKNLFKRKDKAVAN